MIEPSYNKNNTHVRNSYMLTTKKAIRDEVDWIITGRKARKLPVTRSVNSYVREWRGHNRLYNKGLFRSHTKEVDLEGYIGVLGKIKGIFLEVVWLVLGGI